MIKLGFRILFLSGLLLILSSCLGPKTPQEVAQVFWQAVINNDSDAVVKYSTLPNAKSYDSFARDWHGYQLTLGRVTIDGNAANIVTIFTNPSKSEHGERKIITYLIKQNDQWSVDYDHTKMAVQGGALGNLLDSINQFGNDLSKQLDSAADKFRLEMDRMSRELENMAKSFSKQASKTLNKYAEQLQKNIQALEDSINRALKDDKELSDQDRQVLRVAASNLEHNRESLANPTVEAISTSTKSIGNTQQQLEKLDGDSVVKYKREWRQLTHKIESDMREMLNELSSALNRTTI